MRDYKFILLVLSLFISFLQVKADNFSENTDEVSVSETKIYPNPVANGESITIKGIKEFSKIEVINIVGNKIYSVIIPESLTYKLNIEDLKDGIYLLKILHTDNTSIIKRFWVK
jgi:Secretion system C-terminal sorting domain